MNNGELQVELGTGEHTPYLNKNGEFSSDYEDNERDIREFEKQCDTSEKWQNGTVFNHMKSSYMFGNNPLPTLRKKFKGVWKFYDSTHYAYNIWENFEYGEKPMFFVGDNWTVTYQPE